MKKLLLTAALLTLAGCTHTTYTEATRADGSTVKHVAIAPGTSVTTKDGGCINSAGGACEQQSTTATAE